jgi:hypothetical protein
MQSNIFDLLFVVTAVVFNLLIAAIFIASKKMHIKWMRVLGTVWLFLALPLAIVFVDYLLVGKEAVILLAFGGVFLYMLVEWLLDYVFKIDFRSKWSRHIPYILLEYVALFSLIGVAFSINRTAGYIVSIAFWLLMASLIYLYAGKRKSAA